MFETQYEVAATCHHEDDAADQWIYVPAQTEELPSGLIGDEI
jgi:hypothetical protein